MGIKAVVFDLSGTVFKNGGLQDGINEVFTFCEEKGLRIAFVTNNPLYSIKLKAKGIGYDVLATPLKVRRKKPSPAFIDYIENQIGVPRTDFVYVGDSDNNDAFCASNARVLYLSAHWANPDAKYGIPIRSPSMLVNHIKRYLLKDNYWGWELNSQDINKQHIKCLAMFDCRLKDIKQIAKNALKDGNINHRPFIMYNLIASIYLSQTYKDVDYWSTYPPHSKGGSINQAMARYVYIAAKEFRDKYIDLFVRHTESRDSGASRYQGEIMTFKDQIETVHLNSAFAKKIKNKRILVLDDFITNGFSCECARNLLYRAGASDVICVAVGKYGARYSQITITSDFDPFTPIDYQKVRYSTTPAICIFNEKAGQEIEESYATLSKNHSSKLG